MLHRTDSDGLIVITQPAHAWVSGQLARAWGNDHFGPVRPYEAVCLGAEQHDVGWIAWEDSPTLNPTTGQPHSFLELPTAVHIALWSSAARSVLPQSRYAALLVSLHGTGLYEQRDFSQKPAEEMAVVHGFLAREHAFQAALLDMLSRDPAYRPYATPPVLDRNRRLVRAWDWLSLVLCRGLTGQRSLSGIPAADGETEVTLTSSGSDPTRATVEPWPFSQPAITLTCEGRRLPETFTDEAAMRAALAQAPWLTLTMHLSPA